MKFTLFSIAILWTASQSLFAGDYSPKQVFQNPQNCTDTLYDSHRVDAHAPIGVMGDHTHDTGEWMFSYRFMYMDMRQNYVGSDEVTAQSQLSAPGTGPFQIMPTDMQTRMHMMGAMYAPTDDLTLAFMLPVVDKTMYHLTAAGTTFTTATNGIGDFKLGGLVDIFERGNQKAHLNLMMSAPTGSITEEGFVPPAGATLRLPYPMQLGSGTWDFQPGITYLGQCGNVSWGAQLLGAVRLGDNDEGYSLGDEITGNIWGALKLSDAVSTSLRLSAKSWGDIDGRDRRIMGPVPTADPALQRGDRIDLFYGLNFLMPDGPLHGHRFAVEAGTPLYQDLDGPRLGMNWMITAGWQKAF